MNLKKPDDTFSIYIRMRYADDNGYVKCATCPTVSHWKQMDCGHLRLRANLSTRWNEHNAAQQCRLCNGSKDGKYGEMARYLIAKFGIDAIEYVISKSRTEQKPMQYEIDELTEYYKEKIANLVDC